MPAPIALLEKVPLFAGLAPEAMAALAEIAVRRAARARSMLVEQAEPGAELLVLVQGHAKVVSVGADGRDSAINVMGPGEVFGEVALLDGQPRSATVIALDDCTLIGIARAPFLQFLEQHPKVSLELLRVLCDRLRKLTSRSGDVAFLHVGGRLAKCLAALAGAYGERRSDGSVRLPFKLSQQDIGDLVSSTRESANKQLREWQGAGLLAKERGHLVLRDLGRLRAQGGEA